MTVKNKFYCEDEETYLFLSDIHLTESEDFKEVWKPFKHSRNHIDKDLIALISYFQLEKPNYHHHIVLNGDCFDFRTIVRKEAFNLHEHEDVSKLKHILLDHQDLLKCLSAFAETGTIHIIPGNHDLEFNLAIVRRHFRQSIYEASSQRIARKKLYKNLKFYQNHFTIPGFFYAEHGHHYDPFTTMPEYRTLLPKNRRRLVLPFGDYASVYMTNQMGHFNPFDSSSYITSLWGYLKVFFKYNLPNLFSQRDLFVNWFLGAMQTFIKSINISKLLRNNKKRLPKDSNLAQAVLKKIQKLNAPNVFLNIGLMWRTLWLDRFFLGLFSVTFFGALIFNKFIILSSSVWLIYFTLYILNLKQVGRYIPNKASVKGVAKKLTDVVDAPFLIMGHSHKPVFHKFDQGSFFDLGTWAPAFYDIECTKPKYERRRILILTRDNNGQDAEFLTWEEFLSTTKLPLIA